jgi:hypothetical protein
MLEAMCKSRTRVRLVKLPIVRRILFSRRCNFIRLVSAANSQAELALSYYSQSQSHIATDGQSVSKSWCRAPFGAYDQIFSTV